MTGQEVPITKGEIKIVLGLSSELLDEVVVTALGITRSEKSLGFAATQVDGAEIEKARTTNVMQALQGKVAGLQIQTTSSDPGSANNVTIRGLGSINGSNQPLYVVDVCPWSLRRVAYRAMLLPPVVLAISHPTTLRRSQCSKALRQLLSTAAVPATV